MMMEIGYMFVCLFFLSPFPAAACTGITVFIPGEDTTYSFSLDQRHFYHTSRLELGFFPKQKVRKVLRFYCMLMFSHLNHSVHEIVPFVWINGTAKYM